MNDLKAKSSNLFQPNNKVVPESNISSLRRTGIKRNTAERKKKLESFKSDSHVTINEAVKDFARIKKIVDSSPSIDNSDKVEKLKKEIEKGTYNVDYEKLAEKMLTSSF